MLRRRSGLGVSLPISMSSKRRVAGSEGFDVTRLLRFRVRSFPGPGDAMTC